MRLEGYLPAGSYSTETALSIMEKYAVQDYTSEVVQNLVAEITSGISPADQLSQMTAVRNWVYGNLLYVKDPDESKRLFNVSEKDMEHGDLEMIKSPLATLESGRYDCDCGATLIASMLLALGIPARFMAVSFHPYEVTGPDGYSHVFAQGLSGAQWIVLDPVSYPNERQMTKDTKQIKIHYVNY